MRQLTRVGGLIGLSLLIGRVPPPGASASPPRPTRAACTRHCAAPPCTRSSSQSSQLAIYVFRGGKLSKLGHNHVMTSPN